MQVHQRNRLGTTGSPATTLSWCDASTWKIHPCGQLPWRHLKPWEGCESGRIGTLGKRVKGNLPWVRIPPPPPSLSLSNAEPACSPQSAHHRRRSRQRRRRELLRLTAMRTPRPTRLAHPRRPRNGRVVSHPVCMYVLVDDIERRDERPGRIARWEHCAASTQQLRERVHEQLHAFRCEPGSGRLHV
jgi:hypothetical protein